MLAVQAFRTPRPSRRQLPLLEVVGNLVGVFVWRRRLERSGRTAGLRPIFYLDGISAAAWANSGPRLTSGRTVTSTRRTARSPLRGLLDLIEGTCSVTETTR